MYFFFRISYFECSLKNGGNYAPKLRQPGDILNGKYVQRNYNCKFTEKIINEKNGNGHYNIIPVGNIYGYVKSKLSGLRNGK